MQRTPLRLRCEPLDDRITPSAVNVIPESQPADNTTTFHSLIAALPAAGANGTVTVRAGATPEAGVVVTEPGVRIQGETNFPAEQLPQYDVTISASVVTVSNMHLGSVVLSAGVSGATIDRSAVAGLTSTGGVAGQGVNTLSYNTFTGPVTIRGNGDGSPTGDVIKANTFTGNGSLFSLAGDSGADVGFNRFTLTGSGSAVAIQGGANVTVHNNTISATPAEGVAGVVVTGPSTGVIRDNAVAVAGGSGVLISVPSGGDAAVGYAVTANDFRGSGVGVEYSGGGGSTLATTLSANNFRAFTGTATTSNAAIDLHGVAADAVLTATGNVGAAPPLLAADGSIDYTALATAEAYIATLYHDALGRPATADETAYWLGHGTNLAYDIGLSTEAKTFAVDGLYRRYLHRDADATGRGSFVANINGSIQSNGVPYVYGYDSAVTQILASREYVSLHFASPIQGYYQDLLGRTASGPEVASWQGLVDYYQYYYYYYYGSQTYYQVADGINGSLEHRTNVLRDEIVGPLLHRPPTGFEYGLVNNYADTFGVRIQAYATSEYLLNR